MKPITWTCLALAAFGCSAPGEERRGGFDAGVTGPSTQGSIDAGAVDPARPPSWEAARIDFDDLAEGPLSPTAYPEATITLLAGGQPTVWNGTYRIAETSPPNRLCLGPYSDCSGSDEDLRVVFSGPARKIRFDVFGWDSDHPADVELDTDAGTVVIPIVTATSESSGGPPLHVDLSTEAPARELRIVNIDDPAGMGIDTLVFELAR